MGERIQKMKAAAAKAKGKASAPTVSRASTVSAVGDLAPATSATVTHGSIMRKCGHAETLDVSKIKAEHVAGFLAKKSGKLCTSCRAEEDAKQLAARKTPRGNRGMIRADSRQGRLPDGSMFSVVYHENVMQWHGILIIGDKEYKGCASGVFRLLANLDAMYREDIRNGNVPVLPETDG